MESIFIQLPAALYTSIYERYREETGATITACLSRLLDVGTSEDLSPDESSQYSRPGMGTKTGKVWEIADRILKEKGSVNREAVIKACMEEEINVNTASTQYSHWRKAQPSVS